MFSQRASKLAPIRSHQPSDVSQRKQHLNNKYLIVSEVRRHLFALSLNLFTLFQYLSKFKTRR